MRAPLVEIHAPSFPRWSMLAALTRCQKIPDIKSRFWLTGNYTRYISSESQHGSAVPLSPRTARGLCRKTGRDLLMKHELTDDGRYIPIDPLRDWGFRTANLMRST